MAKKKAARVTTKAKHTPRPRVVPRGMYLTVHLADNRELENEVRVESFGDVLAIGHKVARAVREFIRSVPMRPHVSSYSVTVWPTWTPTRERQPKRAHGGRADQALELEPEE